jgi:hypothetical protein
MSRAGALVEGETLTGPMLEGPRVNGNHPSRVIAVSPTSIDSRRCQEPFDDRGHSPALAPVIPARVGGRGCDRGPDVWSVVTPQCVAYARIDVDELATDQIELRLASVRAPAIAVLERAGLTERLTLVATIDEGVARS